MISVCHITTVHPRNDIRIFLKECTSLAPYYQTSLIVCDGKGDAIENDVTIYDVGITQKKRIKRFTKIVNRIYRKAVSLKCDIYHFHDPDFLFAGMLLKKKAIK